MSWQGVLVESCLACVFFWSSEVATPCSVQVVLIVHMLHILRLRKDYKHECAHYHMKYVVNPSESLWLLVVSIIRLGLMSWPNVLASGGVKTSSPPNEVHPGGKSPLCWMRPKYRSIILTVDSILSSADAPLLFMFNPRTCKKICGKSNWLKFFPYFAGWKLSPAISEKKT